MQIKKFILVFIAHGLVACTVLPGMHMSPFSDESSIFMPIQENDATILKKLDIQTITAQTIIELEKDFNNRSLGSNNVSNLYYNYRIGVKTTKGSLISKDFYQYRVGPRDVLTITVWEHPELTIPAGSFRSEGTGNVVGEDGYFYYPYVGAVKAAGRTVEEIRIGLSKDLSKYIEEVQMDVRVARYNSQRVYISGEVRTPNVQFVRDIPLTVLEAIAGAGGVTNGADQRSVTLAREGKMYTINLLALYENGDVSQNIALQHGDILNVPDQRFNKIFILGDINNAGSIFMNKGRMTLNEALSDSRGPNTNQADAARIFIFRSGLGKPEIFHLNTKSPDMLLLAERFPMQPRDIIFVDRTEGQRWNQIINQVQPTLNLIRTAVRGQIFQ